VNRFIEVVRALRSGSQSAAACPQCGSLNISRSTQMDGWLLPTLYLCTNCGYTGRLVLEVDAEDHGREPSEDGKGSTVR
jgi:predicted RNA-binding Zn-ribbon protein involved in translation (DUF1610 family)